MIAMQPYYKLIRFTFGIGNANYTSFYIADYELTYKFMSGLSKIYSCLMNHEPVYFNIGGAYYLCFTDVETLKYCIEIEDITYKQIKVLKELHIDSDSIGKDFVTTVLGYAT